MVKIGGRICEVYAISCGSIMFIYYACSLFQAQVRFRNISDTNFVFGVSLGNAESGGLIVGSDSSYIPISPGQSVLNINTSIGMSMATTIQVDVPSFGHYTLSLKGSIRNICGDSPFRCNFSKDY
jgi:hypothetical protein